MLNLPDWYKCYFLANDYINMEDRPFEFVYNCLKLKPHLLSIINNDYLFCLTDPKFFI